MIDQKHPVEPSFLSTVTELDLARSKLVGFVEQTVRRADADGAVVAMSGGIDSTLTAMLAAEALGSDRVLGLGLPCTDIDDSHAADTHAIAAALGIEFRAVSLQPLVHMFEDVVAPAVDTRCSDRALDNVVARLRAVATYYAANALSYLVVGTANRSERLLGYFTKYGDGAADLYPLGDLYKTEVRALAGTVGVPRRIIEKAPTAGQEAGQTDAADLGADYDVLDPFLRRVVDHGEDVVDAAAASRMDRDLAAAVTARFVDSRHKRDTPPTPQTGGWLVDRRTPPRDRADDLREYGTDAG